MRETKYTSYNIVITDEDFTKRVKSYGFSETVAKICEKGLKLMKDPRVDVHFTCETSTRKLSEAYEDLSESLLWALPEIPELQLGGWEDSTEIWERLEEVKALPNIDVDTYIYIVRVQCLIESIEKHFDAYDYDFENHRFKNHK